jgi:hypothetical protein
MSSTTPDAKVIRVADRVVWFDARQTRYLTGKVLEIGYGWARCLPGGSHLDLAQRVNLDDIQVRQPVIYTGDVVALATFTGRFDPEREQGVVQPVRLGDGLGWYKVSWEKISQPTRHRSSDLLRVPIVHQHPGVQEAARLTDDTGQLLDRLMGRTGVRPGRAQPV